MFSFPYQISYQDDHHGQLNVGLVEGHLHEEQEHDGDSQAIHQHVKSLLGVAIYPDHSDGEQLDKQQHAELTDRGEGVWEIDFLL